MGSFLTISLLLLGCDHKSTENKVKDSSQQVVELTGKTMGTYYNIKYVTQENDLKAKEAIQTEIDSLLENINDEISTYRPESELSLFNKNPSLMPTKISDGMAKNIQISQYVGRKTQGAMDITIGPVVNLWGFGPDKRPSLIPNESDIHLAREKTGLDKITLTTEHDGFYLTKKHPGMYIDLSTVGEGYGADAVGDYLLSKGKTNFLVSIGGTITSRGKSHDGTDWKVAIEKPTDLEVAVQELINLKGQSISTAGSYRNYFEENGTRYSHVIDPNTGKPITHKLISATVIAPSALEADAWDTGLMVLGKDKAMEVAKQNNLAVYLIYKSGNDFKVEMTEQFKEYVIKQEK
ncbi:FAD:protein FMN transferase [Thorsellia kenyensis]|uniref:FAD:protein FMN transferase n=1 Tax=Thorsellia kenyensis TaxID=1549888 RepID=A0ABV6C8B4_9GAMM